MRQLLFQLRVDFLLDLLSLGRRILFRVTDQRVRELGEGDLAQLPAQAEYFTRGHIAPLVGVPRLSRLTRENRLTYSQEERGLLETRVGGWLEGEDGGFCTLLAGCWLKRFSPRARAEN